MKRRTRFLGMALLMASLGPWVSQKAVAQPRTMPPEVQSGPAVSSTPSGQPQTQVISAPPVQVITPTDAPHAGQPASFNEVGSLEPGNATGRQEAGVSIEWVGPSVAKVGQAVSYQIIVKNVCPSPIQHVVVKCPMPANAKVTATEPKAATEETTLVWDLGQFEPRQEKRLDVQMVPSATGAISCQAHVTISGSSSTRLLVREPRLAIKATAPEKVIVGDPATVVVAVSNPGDATAEAVKVVATLSDGLEHARGKTVEFDVGNLAPKESRIVQVLCGVKAEGPQHVDAVATGEPKLTAQDSAAMDVLVPKIELSCSGPHMRYLDRHAVLTFKVNNPGSAAANHVTLIDQVPQGFTFANASGEGRHDFASRTVTWYIGDLPAGQSREVSVDLIATNSGEHHNKCAVMAARGLKSEGEIITRVEGLPALLIELVDLDDPVEVGTETGYEIRVTNTGTKTETNLQLTCEIPEKMTYRGAKAPAGVSFKQEGRTVVFEPLPKLAPRADVIYRVNACGNAPGDMRFRARIKADGLTDAVLKEESTKVYGDEVQQAGHQQ